MILDIVELPLRLKPTDQTDVVIVFRYDGKETDMLENPDEGIQLGNFLVGEELDTFRLYKSIEVVGTNVMMERIFLSRQECNPLKWTKETDVKDIKIYPVMYRRFDVRDGRMHQTAAYKYVNGIKQFFWDIREGEGLPYDPEYYRSLGNVIWPIEGSKADKEAEKIHTLKEVTPLNDADLMVLTAECVDMSLNFGGAMLYDTLDMINLPGVVGLDKAKHGPCSLLSFFNLNSVGSLGLYSQLLQDKVPEEGNFKFNPVSIRDLHMYSLLAEIASAPYTDIDISVNLSETPITTFDVTNRYINNMPYHPRQVKAFCDTISEKIQVLTKHKTYGDVLNSWDRCHIRKTWEEEIFIRFWDGETVLLQEYVSVPILAIISGSIW